MAASLLFSRLQVLASPVVSGLVRGFCRDSCSELQRVSVWQVAAHVGLLGLSSSGQRPRLEQCLEYTDGAENHRVEFADNSSSENRLFK